MSTSLRQPDQVGGSSAASSAAVARSAIGVSGRKAADAAQVRPRGSAAVQPAATPTRSRAAGPHRRDRLFPWLIMIACVALAAVPMLLEIERSDVVNPDEATTLAISSQTWREIFTMPEGRTGLLPMPRLNGQPLMNRPPGVTWLHMLAFTPLDPANTAPDALVLRARLVSVLFGLLAIAALFWIGMSIGGLTTATLAALTCLSMPALLYESRLATAAAVQVGLALLSIAAALWGARPLKPAASPVRQAMGWALCGLALGAAVLVGGIGMVPVVLLPLIAVLAICPRRGSYLLALAAAAFIAALMVTPWALHIHEQSPQAWRGWLVQLMPGPWSAPDAYAQVVGRRVLWIILASVPWTLWVVGGLLQPLSTSSHGARRNLFMGWAWFIALAVVLVLLSPEHGLMQMLLIVPAAALLVGQVFARYTELSGQGRHVRYWQVMRFVHLAIILMLSVAIPLILAEQDNLVRGGWLSGRVTQAMNWEYWSGLGLVLLAIASISVRFVWRHYPLKTLICWSVWTVTAWSVILIPLTRGPLDHSRVKLEGAELKKIVGASPVAYLPLDEAGGGDVRVADFGDKERPDPALLFYSGISMPIITAKQADRTAIAGKSFYLLSPRTQPPSERWRRVNSLPFSGQRLWRTSPPAKE